MHADSASHFFAKSPTQSHLASRKDSTSTRNLFHLALRSPFRLDLTKSISLHPVKSISPRLHVSLCEVHFACKFHYPARMISGGPSLENSIILGSPI
ncbi:hypothetical protein ACLB2K_008524 [Fragaria x ananassa]